MARCLVGFHLQVIRAQDQILVLRSAVIALLLIEGLLIMFVAVGLVMRMLNSISIHRQALFSVFLAIPNNYLRTLANRGVNIGDESDDEDDGEFKQTGCCCFPARLVLSRLPCSHYILPVMRTAAFGHAIPGQPEKSPQNYV